MLQHRHFGLLHHGADEPLAPARNHHVDEFIERKQRGHGLAVRGGRRLHAGCGQPGGNKRLVDQLHVLADVEQIVGERLLGLVEMEAGHKPLVLHIDEVEIKHDRGRIAAALCIKSGNAAILRGGSEAFHSIAALMELIHEALASAGLPAACVQAPPTTDREAVAALLKLDEFIDVVIPRGGEGLIRTVVEQAKMPVLKHYKGVCHAFVDKRADLARAVDIVLNAKAQRPGTCNSLECLLVHKDVAAEFLPAVAKALGAANVLCKCCEKSLPLVAPHAKAEPAAEDDWGREFLALVLAVKVVDGLDEALDHIARHGSNHTEVILTNDHANAMRFTREADASMVAVNASTRLNDGGELGLGAEIGISTTKLHAYGPMGILELTSAKFVVLGQGQIRN